MRFLKLLVVLMTPLKILSWALPGAGCCAEHISGMIPSDSQESPRYSSCPHEHMGKPRHRKQICDQEVHASTRNPGLPDSIILCVPHSGDLKLWIPDLMGEP